MHTSTRVFAAILLCGFLVLTAPGAVISVNFVGGNGNTTNFNGPSVTTIAGVVRVGNWNNAAMNNGAFSLIDDGGVPAGSISYTSPNVYGAIPNGGGISGGAGDTALMTGYLDNVAGGSGITVTGLPASFTAFGYTVLVFQASDSSGSFGYTITDNASHTDTAFGRQLGGNGGNYPLAGGTDGYIGSSYATAEGPATAANYVILEGLTGSSFTLIGVNGSTGDGRARINGFQVVAVPEPGSALLGIGLTALLGTARRRRMPAI